MDSSFPNINVVFLIVPFPLQSHLNQLLRLSNLISSRGFPVHYAASVVHCRQAKLRHEYTQVNTSKIIFHELVIPPFLSPDPSSTAKFPQHLWPATQASMNLREPVAALLSQLTKELAVVDTTRTRSRRLVIIHDPLLAYVVQDAASLPNVESYSFNCGSAFCSFCFTCQFSGKPFPLELKPDAIPTMDNCISPEIVKFFGLQSQFDHLGHGKLFNTCREIEGPYLDLLAQTTTHAEEEEDVHKKKKKKQWAISPLFPIIANDDEDKAHPTLEWLDKQPPKSVIYVSFGSITTMSHEQINELALGLEESKQRFLWVLRDADRGDIFNGETRILPLPIGFEERVKGVGKVTRDWVPQLGILRHPSVGGFLCHCGWNSCLESLTMGVPLATWPMHSDQPHNALLITHILKVGIPVIGWGERDQLVTSSVIKKSVEGLMASSEGHEVRTRAEELGKVIRQQSVQGDFPELNSFLAYAAR
ncbi:zeatin O-xylosyltransferase-like [Impatiens glandulifera]|uniref:zeatin O-xylosyltransferase-like n=1 Tax=Impatiens glandulifera TaxID=253017 RepID=UPI001FB15A60|nr:zeatin O-xylosyltransferase-like [Impatiens glandulifera]